MDRVPSAARRPAARGGRLLPWLVVIVFLLQFVLAAQHHHDGAAKARHCAACALHAQPHAGPPAAVAPSAQPRWNLLYRVHVAALAGDDVATADFILPPAQAPPVS